MSAVRIDSLTLQFVTGPTGSIYSPKSVSTCNSEIIFNAGAALTSQHRQLSVAVRDVYSSSSKLLMLSLLVKYQCAAQ